MKRLLNLSQLVRGQIHVGNGASNQLTSDAEPLLSRCRTWLVVEAIKDGAFGTNTVESIYLHPNNPLLTQ